MKTPSSLFFLRMPAAWCGVLTLLLTGFAAMGGARTASAERGFQDPKEPDPKPAVKTTIPAAAEDIPEIEEAMDFVRTGLSVKAVRSLTKVLEEEPKNAAVLAARALANAAGAQWDDAYADAKAVVDTDPKNSRMLLILSTVDSRRGKIDEAIAFAVKAAEGDLPRAAKVCLSKILDDIGEEAKAEAEARAAVNSIGAPSAPRETLSLGQAFERIGDFESASEQFVEVSSVKPVVDDPLVSQDGLVALGNLYNRVYRQSAGHPGGEKEFNDVLKKNPSHSGALLGRYRIGIVNYQLSSEKTEEVFRRLLEIDPKNPEALLLKIEGMVNDRQFDAAGTVVTELLTQNPRLRHAQAEKAALDFLQHRMGDYEKAIDEDRRLHPTDSDFPRTLGEHLKSLYRFSDAIPQLEEAAKRNKKDGEARTALGECFAHVGREAEAKKQLEEAESIEEGFVHPWRDNMIKVLTALEDEYLTVRSPNFEFKLHPKDEPILRETLLPFYENTRRAYGERYGYVPKEKVVVEVFNQFPDFSVRSVGFTGFGALGVCFGSLITAVSPLANPFRGNFSYLDTAWHEYAHVVHLALSRGRVPRWYTEGLATLEEVKRNPAFDRRMELELLEARATGQIYPILELNSAFRGPRIIFGYYQGGLLCEFLEKKTSPERLVEALTLFGKDLPLESVITQAFGLSVTELDAKFLEFVDEKLSRVKVRPALDAITIAKLRAKVAKNRKDVESLRALGWAYAKTNRIADADGALEKLRDASPNDAEGLIIRAELSLQRKRPDLAKKQFAEGFAGGAEEFFSRLKYASLLEQEKDFDNVKIQLRAAIAAFPEFADPGASPHVKLAKILAAEEKTDECRMLLEEFCKISGAATEPRLELAAIYERKGDAVNLSRVLGEILDVDPFQRALQRRRALALLDLTRFAEAAESAKLARLVEPTLEPPKRDRRPGSPVEEVSQEVNRTEQAECAAIEAQALLGLGKLPEARAAVNLAIQLDITNERALQQREILDNRGNR